MSPLEQHSAHLHAGHCNSRRAPRLSSRQPPRQNKKEWSALSESASHSSHGTPDAAHINGNIDAAPRLVAYDHESRRPMFAFILYILAALMVVIALVISSEASEPLQAAPLWGSAVVVGGLGVVAQLLQRLCQILKDIRAELQNRR